ncbi:uncharacterized protein [Nothobranchius furzeri]
MTQSLSPWSKAGAASTLCHSGHHSLNYFTSFRALRGPEAGCSQPVCWGSLSCGWITLQDTAMVSVLEQPSRPGSFDDLAELFLHRLQQEPWALGGFVVMVVFVLGVLSLVLFALLYGRCHDTQERTQERKKELRDNAAI